MKLLIGSDIHGDAAGAKTLVNVYKKEKCDRILLLGDILYHGPRNDLPAAYAPKEVIAMLGEVGDRILSVRGNCEAEVDQMVLPFPVLADYALLCLDGLTVFATHGHLYNTEKKPPLAPGDILLHGHTHLYACEDFGNGNTYLNPGSVSLPKGGNPKTYMIYEDRTFTLYDAEGKVLFTKSF